MNLDQFTKKPTYDDIAKSLSSTAPTVFNINGASIPVVNKAVVPATADAASLLKASNRSVNITNYYAPSKIVLDTFSELGKDLDKSIKSAFLLQTFNIKGTDILCAMFCFMISLMSCSERTALANTIANINKGTQALASGARGVKGMVDTVNASVMSTQSIGNNISQIFSNPGATTKSTIGNTLESASVLAAVPSSLMQNAKLIINALKFGKNFKFMMPNATGKGIWDLSQNVLFALQGMAVQAADEALRKIIKPVEDKINKIQPAICFNNMADRIRIQIFKTINSLKSRILAEVASLFQSNSGFNFSLRQINAQCGWSLELVAFMDALNFLSANFQQIAVGCGVAPCTPSPRADQFKSSDIGNIDTYVDSVNPFGYTPPTTPTILKISNKPTTSKMDDVANKFKDFMSPDNIKIDENSIKSTYNINNNAPQQIKDFIASGLLNNILDSNYSIDPKNATITYNYNKKCGE